MSAPSHTMIVHSILLEEASDISALRRMCELCSDTRRLHGMICFLSYLVVLTTQPLFCLGLRGRTFETETLPFGVHFRGLADVAQLAFGL